MSDFTSRAEIEAAMDRLAPIINDIIAENDEPVDDEQLQRVKAAAQRIVDMCIEVNAAYIAQLRPGKVAVHPENRLGDMLLIEDVHVLLRLIFGQGFVDTEVQTPRAFEKRSGALGEEQERKNQELADTSDGYLPPLDSMEVIAMGVCANNTNATLRLVNSRCKCDYKELTDENGFISKTKILSKCPSYGTPSEAGLTWVVFREGIEIRCPGLPAFISQAGNAGHGVHREQSIHAILLHIHKKIQAVLNKGQQPNYDKVAKAIEHAFPALAGQCSDQAKYVANFGGGKNAIYLHQVADFAKCLKVTRILPPQHFKLFGAALKLAFAPEHVAACTMAAANCPDHPSYLVRGEARLWNSSDIAFMTSAIGKPKVAEAKELMIKGKEWIASVGANVDKTTKTLLVGRFMVALVMSLHKKKARAATSPKVHDNFDDCKDEFLLAAQTANIPLGGAPFAWSVAVSAPPTQA